MYSSVSVTGVGVTHYVNRIFFRSWFRWPIVVSMDLLRYLVTYATVNPAHDSQNFFDSFELCRRDRSEHGGI